VSEPLSIGPGTASKPLGGWARHDQLPGQATISFQPPKLWEWYIAAADAVDALGLPPDKLEASVRALVRALREAPDMGGCCDICDAKHARRVAALAPFARLGGEP